MTAEELRQAYLAYVAKHGSRPCQVAGAHVAPSPMTDEERAGLYVYCYGPRALARFEDPADPLVEDLRLPTAVREAEQRKHPRLLELLRGAA